MKVGLALGGGSVKGLAHIGVLKVLEKHKIKIDYISGTSIGAVVAGLYASGMSVKQLEKIATKTKWKNLIDFVVPKDGFLKGDKIEEYLRVLLNNKRFEDLNVSCGLVAVDLNSGNKVVFKKGDVAKAIRASISIPGVFVPVKLRNLVLVDGSVVDPVPGSVVREMGADVVIGVNLFQPYKEVFTTVPQKTKGFENIFKSSLLYQEVEYLEKYLEKKSFEIPLILQLIFNPVKLAKLIKNSTGKFPPLLKITWASNYLLINELSRRISKEDIDMVINPSLKNIKELEFTRAKYIIGRGETAAKEKISEIKKLLKNAKNKT